MNKKTNISQLLGDLNAGVFEQQVDRALSDVALNVVETGKKGRVTITFDLKQIGESSQVAMTHKLAYLKPMRKGKATEEYAADTPLHVGAGGVLSLFPHEQLKMELTGAGPKAGA
jgi:fructose 1,6-bisphosphatase